MPVRHKLISKKKNVNEDHKGRNETWILWLIPFVGMDSGKYGHPYTYMYIAHTCIMCLWGDGGGVGLGGGGGVGVVYLEGTAKDTVFRFKLSGGWSLY